ncbi:MAG: TraM recognition domain-containing protein [Bifidobacterium crudilactis]|jgi:type IV secretory pathway TraG/TraD family ATPase VirD4|nr:TraM recognition domain-containing protein [Bifidobacterium crudilactis]
MADVDPKLQSNRVKDLGQLVQPSHKMKMLAVAVVAFILLAFGAVASLDGGGFDWFAMLGVLSSTRAFTGSQWLLLLALLVSVPSVCCAVWFLVRRLAGSRLSSGSSRTRVDVYAPAMGHGDAVEKVGRARAQRMAQALIKAELYRASMSPGFPLGRNVVDGVECFTSWEDMAIVLAGPRSGKSLCYAIPAVLSAPGACVATSNKGDILDVTRPVRERDHPDGRIWVFDPEHIADPSRRSAPWVWDLIASVSSIADAKRIADCWRYASGQPQTGGDDFFPGTAAQQLADYLFAAHLGGCSAFDVFKWCSDERNTTAGDILRRHPRYEALAARVNSVIGLTEETRSGVFGSLQTMVSFLADPEIMDWIRPLPGDGTDEGRPLFDPYAFATSEDTLYLLSAQGRPSTALTAALTAVVAFTAFTRAQSEFTDNNRRLPVPLCCVLDEAANICRWPELADVYSYFGSAGIPIMTIWQNPDQGKAAFGETNFGSLFNNANITVYIGGIKDSKWLSEVSQLVGQREIVRSNLSIDHQGKRSTSRSIQKESILDVADLAEWPIGRALVLASQSRAQIVVTLPWTGNKSWADTVARARQQGK